MNQPNGLQPENANSSPHELFHNSHEEFEIETLDEFHDLIAGKDIEKLSLKNWVFQEVDFSSEPLEQWKKYDIKGAYFWGCKFPPGVHEDDVWKRGAHVLENPVDVPFRALRGTVSGSCNMAAFMYSQKELIENDQNIYQHYLQHKDMRTKMAQAMHDYCINEALYGYLEGKTPVGIMGGHGTKRDSTQYRSIVNLARDLARQGFLVMTGGGPGAMEAANLGGYLCRRTPDEVDEALALIGEGNEKFDPEFLNSEASNKVLQRFGYPTYDLPSLGIPTFKYGHEPPNRFASWQAKFFSNAVREEDVVSICSGGIIFTPGSAGTRQEIFQAACQNHYAADGACSPMVFIGKQFWIENGVFSLIEESSRGKEYHDMLLCTDDQEEIVKHLLKHARVYKLPLNDFVNKRPDPRYWMRPNKSYPSFQNIQ